MKTSLRNYFDNRPKSLKNFNLQNVDNKIQNVTKMSRYHGNIHQFIHDSLKVLLADCFDNISKLKPRFCLPFTKRYRKSIDPILRSSQPLFITFITVFVMENIKAHVFGVRNLASSYGRVILLYFTHMLLIYMYMYTEQTYS